MNAPQVTPRMISRLNSGAVLSSEEVMALDSRWISASIDALHVVESNRMALYRAAPKVELFHRSLSDRRLLRAGNRIGKAQPRSCLVLTPDGWALIGDVRVGDMVIAGDGSPTKVLGVYPQGRRHVVRLTFTGGAKTRCDLEHLWRAREASSDDWHVVPVSDLLRFWGPVPPERLIEIPVLETIGGASVPLKQPARRWLEHIEDCGEEDSVCIEVDHPSHTYVTDDYIVTHNTIAGSIETWWYASGLHPYRTVRRKSDQGLILGASWDSCDDDIGKSLWDWAPRHLIHPSSDYQPNRGWKNNQILLRDRDNPQKVGHVIHFRSGEQDVIHIAGLTVDYLWINEPPLEQQFYEAVQRVADAEGPVWMTFTPFGRPVTWLRLHIEGDEKRQIPPKERWEQFVIELAPENVPHRSKRSIMKQIAGIPIEQYAQRVDAHWEGIVTNRRMQGFKEVNKRSSLGTIQYPIEHGWKFGIGCDHGDTAGHQVVILMAWHDERQVAWAIDEYISAERTIPRMDARQIVIMLRRNGIQLRRLVENRGDINGTFKSSPLGESVNLQLGREITIAWQLFETYGPQVAGWSESEYSAHAEKLLQAGVVPLPIEAPDKRSGSVDWGLGLMNTAFMSGGLYIDPRCDVLTRSLATWQGKKDGSEHAIDALRYEAASILDRFINASTVYTGAVGKRRR